MPRVPTYSDYQATPAIGPTPQFRGLQPFGSAPQMRDVAGKQAQVLGNTMQRAGGEVGRIALGMIQQANQLRVDDALNQAKETALDLTYGPQGFTNIKGEQALNRPDGQPLADEYGQQLKKHIDQIADGLGNDAQRQAFMLHAGDILTAFHGHALQHESQAYQTYALSTSQGIQDTSMRDIALNYHNPDATASAVQRLQAEVYRQAQLQGKSAEWVDATSRTLTSQAHKLALTSAIQSGDTAYAGAYLKKYSDEMDAGDILTIRKQLGDTSDAQQAQNAVGAAQTDLVNQVQPNDFDRMVHITLGSESGDRDYDAQGNVVTSGAGAKGRMQVRDPTNKDPGFGVKPAQDDSLAERARVGRDYLQAMLKRYGGDPAKAWAAYNAGPGALDDAIAQAKKDAGAPGGQVKTWLAYMPAETQKYVQANMAAYENGGGTPKRPTELEFVNTALNRLGPNATPQAVTLTRTQAERAYTLVTQSYAQKGEDAVRAAQQWIAQNDGDFTGLPANLRADVVQYAPDKLTGLKTYASALAQGNTETNLVLYNRLASHPDEMARMTDSEFESLRAHLSPADFKRFAGERADMLSGKSNASPDAIDTSAFNQSLNLRLNSLDIPTSPKNSDTKAQERLGAIRQFARSMLFDAQAQAGKKFTPADVDQFMNNLFAKSVTFQHSFLGIGWTTRESLAEMTYGDIPSPDLNGLRQAFAAHGIQNPTETDLLNAYRRMKAK